VKWKGPRRVASVGPSTSFLWRICSRRSSRLRIAGAEHNDHGLYVVSKILDARYNEQEIFYELLVAWRDFPVKEAT
jgi:hypothetical protein